MTDLIQEAKLFIEENIGPGVLRNRSLWQSNYTKYTTDLYSYVPLPYYELRRIDGNTVFKDYSPSKKVLFYFHIPFCAYKCTFCYYYSFAGCTDGFIDRYLDCLRKETEIINAKIPLSGLPMHSLHFGGGTPCSLSLRQLSFLFSAVRKVIKIDSKDCFAFETSPETILGEGKLRFLLESGVSHIDIGVQTFQDDVLSFVNRRHTSETAKKAFVEAEKAGFGEINLDMMINLPGQTLKGWEDDLKQLASLRPTSITLHQAVLKTGSMQELYFRDRDKFSHSLDILIMKAMAHIFLERNGYQLQKVDFYSLKHKVAGLPEDIPEVLSFGVRSWSCFNSFEYYNAMYINEYMKIVENGKLPIALGAKVQQDRALRKFVMRGLKDTVNGLEADLWDKYKRLNNDTLRQAGNIERMQLTRIVQGRLKLNLAGIFFVDDIFKELCEGRAKVLLFEKIILGNRFLRYIYFKALKSAPQLTSRFFICLNALFFNLKERKVFKEAYRLKRDKGAGKS